MYECQIPIVHLPALAIVYRHTGGDAHARYTSTFRARASVIYRFVDFPAVESLSWESWIIDRMRRSEKLRRRESRADIPCAWAILSIGCVCIYTYSRWSAAGDARWELVGFKGDLVEC